MPQIRSKVGKGRICRPCRVQVYRQSLGKETVPVWCVDMDDFVQQGPSVVSYSLQGHLYKASVSEIARHKSSANSVRATDVNPDRFVPSGPPKSFHLLALTDRIAIILLSFANCQLV